MISSHTSPLSIASRRRLAVAAGGAVGAMARLAVSEAVDAAGFNLLWATFTVNVLGSLLLGFVVARHTGRSRTSPLLIPLVGVGVLGAFTTFSLFSTDVLGLLREASWGLAIGYPIGTVVIGLGAAFVGVSGGAKR